MIKVSILTVIVIMLSPSCKYEKSMSVEDLNVENLNSNGKSLEYVNAVNRMIAEERFLKCESIAKIAEINKVATKLPDTYESIEILMAGDPNFYRIKGKVIFDYKPTQNAFLVTKQLFDHDGNSYKLGITKSYEVAKISEKNGNVEVISLEGFR